MAGLIMGQGGAIAFCYDRRWRDRNRAFPVSLSLSLRDDPWCDEPVAAMFENLRPHSDALHRRLAERAAASPE